MIPFLSLKDVTALHGAEINEAVSRVVNGGWYLQGKENEKFEENYSKFIGTKFTIGCANGLDALIWIFRAYIEIGVMQPGDEDWDQPNPLGVYARSKYMGERFVVENARRYLVCRAGWMMGAGPSKDKKFIQKIMKQLKDGKKELFIVNDKDGTPTYTQDFAKTVKNLIQKEYWGLYNCVCGGQTSRLEVCEELLKILGLQDEIKINVVTSEYFAKEYFADRPACERLWTRKLNIRGVNAMRDWKVSLKEYIDNYYKGYLD